MQYAKMQMMAVCDEADDDLDCEDDDMSVLLMLVLLPRLVLLYSCNTRMRIWVVICCIPFGKFMA